MKQFIKYSLIVSLAFGAIVGCTKSKVVLDEKQFTSLLIDMHRTDGSLALTRVNGFNEGKNYAYYNDVFKKYGISRADFDSCMFYYSGQTALFSKMYDVVIDSLNKELTEKNRELSVVKARDTVNLFPYPDTLVFDTSSYYVTAHIDSLSAGLYNFSTIIQLEAIDKGKNNRITSYFVSSDLNDTLYVPHLDVKNDTLRQYYNWSQYVDSTYNQLVIKYIDSDNLGKLKYRNARAWNGQLFSPFLSRERRHSLQSAFDMRK